MEECGLTIGQMAFREDMMAGKVEWTGDTLVDFKYFLWFNHVVISTFRASGIDPFTRGERLTALIMQCSFNVFLSMISHQVEKGDEC